MDMEELPELKSGGVSLKSQHKLPSYANGKWENICLSRAFKHSTMESKTFSSIINQSSSSEAPKSPAHAMEFLCRSWSSSASDFQQMFPSSNLFLPPSVNDRIEEHEESKAEEETLENQASSSRYITNKVDNSWMDFKYMKGWPKLKPLTNFFRSRDEKKKQEVRLHTAKLHAALSLTQLAASIAGFATSSSAEAQDHIKHIATTGGGRLALWDQDTGIVVASAAALLTTVCAEAAESLGAKRARVASAVKSGLATQNPVDMVTLTATAATCLRGAATLKSRTKAGTNLPRNQELLKVGAQISIVMPSGEKGLKWVTVYLKQRQLTLSFRRKYLGGVLTATKKYMIINVIEESKDIKGSYFLSLMTNKGIVKLLFEDEKQSVFWVSTISNLLEMHNSC